MIIVIVIVIVIVNVIVIIIIIIIIIISTLVILFRTKCIAIKQVYGETLTCSIAQSLSCWEPKW